MSYLYSSLSLDLGIAACAFAAVSSGLFFLCRKRKHAVEMLDALIDVSETGQIIFNGKGAFLKANDQVLRYVPFLKREDLKSLTKEVFLNILYDHAADFDESIRNTIFSNNVPGVMPSFREVIECCKGGYSLVDGREMNRGMTLFTMTDISMGRRREQSIIHLNVFNSQLMEAVQATTSGIIVSDPKQDGNPILFANNAFCEFSSCRRSDLIGANWSVLMPLFRDKTEKEKFISALSEGKDADLELGSDVDGKKRCFSMKLSPVFDEKDNLDLYIGVLSDVTLLKQREAEFFHAQKLESLGQLAAGIAHDFNNILSIIGGYSVMALNALEADSAQVKNHLEKIDSAAARGAGLTRKMLTFSRHQVVDQSVINVCNVVNEQRGLLVPLMGVYLTLKVSMSEQDVNIRGNSDSLGQILMNLAINARDSMSDGGVLNIDVSCLSKANLPQHISKIAQAEEYVRIAVSDTGTGMDEATIKRIFDPFFSTKEQGKGTGLGLSVVYGLVHEMGGVLDVVSVLGQGTTMALYVPRSYEAVSKSIVGDVVDIANIRLDGYTVLVAEDEPDLLRLVTILLEGLGLKVLVASDGNEALELQDDYMDDIDILLTDVIMPELSGVKLAELMKSLRPDIKTIFMSGYPASGDKASIELPEGATFIAKPVDYELLTRVILQKLGVRSDESVGAMPYWETSKGSGALKDV